jgi:hypothetical protein
MNPYYRSVARRLRQQGYNTEEILDKIAVLKAKREGIT